MKKLAGALFLAIILCRMSFAAAQDVMTKKEVILKLSASDTVKKKIAELFSWNGYDLSKIRQAIPTPVIKNISLMPDKVPLDGAVTFEVAAIVEDPSGPENISGVRANLIAVGGLANLLMVDNGLYGDKKAFDQVYTLQTSVTQKTSPGPKEIAVAAANKDGWVALAKTTLEIYKSPPIIK
ncbi:MAG: hypothetical protein QME05_06725 [Candidatus Margulisbacteria bacterium]|nr:hypothetical protein [Candidatus Margulisiibacteriota bacterium]